MLELKPVTLAEANAFVAQHHRHHKPVTGHKFSIGCMENGRLVGVAIVGRPVSRYLDNGFTLGSQPTMHRRRKKMLAVCFMPQHGGRRGLWAIAKSLPIFLILKTAQAYAPPVELRRACRRQALDGKPPPHSRPLPCTNEIPLRKANLKGVFIMANNRIDRIDREIEKTREKITEYQNKLKVLEAQKTEAETCKSSSSCALCAPDPAELNELLSGGAIPGMTAADYEKQEDNANEE